MTDVSIWKRRHVTRIRMSFSVYVPRRAALLNARVYLLEPEGHRELKMEKRNPRNIAVKMFHSCKDVEFSAELKQMRR